MLSHHGYAVEAAWLAFVADIFASHRTERICNRSPRQRWAPNEKPPGIPWHTQTHTHHVCVDNVSYQYTYEYEAIKSVNVHRCSMWWTFKWKSSTENNLPSEKSKIWQFTPISPTLTSVGFATHHPFWNSEFTKWNSLAHNTYTSTPKNARQYKVR